MCLRKITDPISNQVENIYLGKLPQLHKRCDERKCRVETPALSSTHKPENHAMKSHFQRTLKYLLHPTGKKKNPEQGKPTHYQWLAKNKNKNKRSQLLENSDKLMQKLPGNLTNMQKIVSINERKHIDESDHKLDEQ